MRKIVIILFLALSIISVSGSSILAAESVYIVKSGDSLWGIAQSHGISVDTIKKINNLKSDFLNIGDRLILTSTSANASAKPTASAVSTNTVNNTGGYTVKSGDTLWGIAIKFNTTVDRIKQLNGLNSDALTIGQKLNLGGSVATPSRSADNVDGSRIVATAAQYLGTPYAYGGQSPDGFDCSGFVYYVFNQHGYSLPRTAASQYNKGVAVDKDNLQVGDLVFFAIGGSGINHVGIYSGNGQFIHSSSPRNGGVVYSSINDGYYGSYYTGARRILR